ncbi:MAG: ATP-binding protein [Lachnospiraceae bacterium]|nr:ATP-binding protein [Lachnospiraceae bacterium]
MAKKTEIKAYDHVENPFTLLFGKEPSREVSRAMQQAIIEDSFTEEEPSQQVYLISGVRGSGKTVFMTNVSKKITSQKGWILVNLNPERDMLNSLAAKLAGDNELVKIFKNAKINLSFFGFGLEVSNTAPIADIEMALSKMLESLKKHHKRVFITVDEVTNSKEMREFSAAFQIFIREGLPVFLLMTGLYDNINAIQNEKSLTFLYRAPRIDLTPLNISAVAANYAAVFGMDEKKALKMAKYTKGYPFAFQVLGHMTWEKKGDFESVLEQYKLYLYEYSYEKIWAELSQGDKKILYGIASAKSGKVSDIRAVLGIETNEFNPYRKRLIKKGLISSEGHGYVDIMLPMFDKFVIDMWEEDNEDN